MSREKWVATPFVDEATGSELMIGHTGLPVGLDPERIEWNVDKLRRGIIGWGGYEAGIFAAHRGEEDSVSMNASTGGSGTGTAAPSIAISRAETSQHNSASDTEKNATDLRNGTLGVSWNINALNSRLDTYEQYDPKIRAKQINSVVKRAAMKGVWKHNVSEVFGSPALALGDAFAAYFVSSSAIEGDYPQTAKHLAFCAAWCGLIRGVNTLRATGQDMSPTDAINDPLFISMRPTRAAVGMGILASGKLVRAA